jgi:hypothetical protein
MKKLLNLFKLPTPVELGRAAHDALPLRDLLFEDSEGKYTWEDWREEVKRDYPIRYFLNRTLPYFFNSCIYPFTFVYNFLKYNLCPKHRYHILDLRQPKAQCDTYRWGYSDPRERMLYACFNLLKELVERELSPIETTISNCEKRVGECKDEDEKNILFDQLLYFKEINSLYEWWKDVRKVEYEEKEIMYDLDKNKWMEASQRFEEKEQEMFMRLAKIREYLWT